MSISRNFCQNSVISTLCHYTMLKQHLKNISWNQFPWFNSFLFSVLPCMLPLLRDNLKSSSTWSRNEELNLILEAKVDKVLMILLGTESLKNPPNICVNLCPLDGDRTTLQFRFETSYLYFWIIFMHFRRKAIMLFKRMNPFMALLSIDHF